MVIPLTVHLIYLVKLGGISFVLAVGLKTLKKKNEKSGSTGGLNTNTHPYLSDFEHHVPHKYVSLFNYKSL